MLLRVTYGCELGLSLATKLEIPEKISLNVHCSLIFSDVCMAVSMNKVLRFSMNSVK